MVDYIKLKEKTDKGVLRGGLAVITLTLLAVVIFLNIAVWLLPFPGNIFAGLGVLVVTVAIFLLFAKDFINDAAKQQQEALDTEKPTK